LTLRPRTDTLSDGVISSWYVLLVGLGGGVVNSLLIERNSPAAAIGGASFMNGLVQSRVTTVRAAQADAKLKKARTVAEVQRAGHDLMRSVVEYRRAHTLHG